MKPKIIWKNVELTWNFSGNLSKTAPAFYKTIRVDGYFLYEDESDAVITITNEV